MEIDTVELNLSLWLRQDIDHRLGNIVEAIAAKLGSPIGIDRNGSPDLHIKVVLRDSVLGNEPTHFFFRRP